MAAKYEQQFILNYNIDPLYHLVSSMNFVQDLKLNLLLNSREPQNCCLRYDHGMSMSSWGEEITMLLTPMNAGTTCVSIRSECTMPTQIIDWGKNKKMVMNIYDYIVRNIGIYVQWHQNQSKSMQ